MLDRSSVRTAARALAQTLVRGQERACFREFPSSQRLFFFFVPTQRKTKKITGIVRRRRCRRRRLLLLRAFVVVAPRLFQPPALEGLRCRGVDDRPDLGDRARHGPRAVRRLELREGLFLIPLTRARRGREGERERALTTTPSTTHHHQPPHATKKNKNPAMSSSPRPLARTSSTRTGSTPPGAPPRPPSSSPARSPSASSACPTRTTTRSCGGAPSGRARGRGSWLRAASTLCSRGSGTEGITRGLEEEGTAGRRWRREVEEGKRFFPLHFFFSSSFALPLRFLLQFIRSPFF